MNFSDSSNFLEIDAFKFYRDNENDNGEYEIEIFNPYITTYDLSISNPNNYRIFPPGNFPIPPLPNNNNNNMNNPSQPPSSPPPSYMPAKNDKGVNSFNSSNQKFVSGGSIRPCLFRYVYIWQNNGRSYWAYLTYVTNRSIAGWRWMGWRWIYFGLDLNKINSFYCI